MVADLTHSGDVDTVEKALITGASTPRKRSTMDAVHHSHLALSPCRWRLQQCSQLCLSCRVWTGGCGIPACSERGMRSTAWHPKRCSASQLSPLAHIHAPHCLQLCLTRRIPILDARVLGQGVLGHAQWTEPGRTPCLMVTNLSGSVVDAAPCLAYNVTSLACPLSVLP